MHSLHIYSYLICLVCYSYVQGELPPAIYSYLNPIYNELVMDSRCVQHCILANREKNEGTAYPSKWTNGPPRNKGKVPPGKKSNDGPPRTEEKESTGKKSTNGPPRNQREARKLPEKQSTNGLPRSEEKRPPGKKWTNGPHRNDWKGTKQPVMKFEVLDEKFCKKPTICKECTEQEQNAAKIIACNAADQKKLNHYHRDKKCSNGKSFRHIVEETCAEQSEQRKNEKYEHEEKHEKYEHEEKHEKKKSSNYHWNTNEYKRFTYHPYKENKVKTATPPPKPHRQTRFTKRLRFKRQVNVDTNKESVDKQLSKTNGPYIEYPNPEFKDSFKKMSKWSKTNGTNYNGPSFPPYQQYETKYPLKEGTRTETKWVDPCKLHDIPEVTCPIIAMQQKCPRAYTLHQKLYKAYQPGLKKGGMIEKCLVKISVNSTMTIHSASNRTSHISDEFEEKYGSKERNEDSTKSQINQNSTEKAGGGRNDNKSMISYQVVVMFLAHQWRTLFLS